MVYQPLCRLLHLCVSKRFHINLYKDRFSMRKYSWIPFLFITLISCSDSDYSVNPVPPAIPTDESPAWSPDGKWIAYWHYEPTQADSLYPTGLYTVDTGGLQRKILRKGIALNPDWSPDGTRMVFDNGANIFTLEINTLRVAQLTSGSGHHFPSWASNATLIAYDIAINDSAGIWIMSATGHDKKRLWAGRNPDWSPDNQYLVFEGFGGIRAANLDSTTTKLLAASETGYRNPAWSPDGKKIAWSATSPEISGAEIWVMNSDGAGKRRVTSGASPSWSPGSDKLVYTKPVADHSRIVLCIINLETMQITQLTP